ncbi:MAG: hypothetical protein ACK5NN_14820 [Sphingomonadaceae bacterium]
MPDIASAMQPGFDPVEAMEQLAARNPQMAMLVQMMQQQQAAFAAPEMAPEVDVTDDRDALIVELGERLDSTEERLQRMTRIARNLHTAQQQSLERLGDLAAALGACGLCWGEDDQCPACRGQGQPGMIRPDMELRSRIFGSHKGPHRIVEEPPPPEREHNKAII